MLGLLGEERDRLDPRGARADDPDALPGDVDALVGPPAGVIRRPREGIDAVDLRELRRRQAADRHDQEAGVVRSPASVSTDQRAEASFHVAAVTLRLEADVAAQVESIGHVVGVGEDLRLGGVALGPVPLLLQLGGERVGVVHRLDVATGTRVAVPPPGPTHVGRGFDHLHVEPLVPEAVQQVHAGEAGAHHDHVEIGTDVAARCFLARRLGHPTRPIAHRHLPLRPPSPSSCPPTVPPSGGTRHTGSRLPVTPLRTRRADPLG